MDSPRFPGTPVPPDCPLLRGQNQAVSATSKPQRQLCRLRRSGEGDQKSGSGHISTVHRHSTCFYREARLSTRPLRIPAPLKIFTILPELSTRSSEPSHGSDGKESPCNAEDPDSIPGSGRSLGERNGYPLQYSCLENSKDRGAWRATV